MHDKLTARQYQALQEYATQGDMKRAAYVLGCSLQTMKNHVSDSYRRLEVDNALGAFRALGWLVVADPAPMTMGSDGSWSLADSGRIDWDWHFREDRNAPPD